MKTLILTTILMVPFFAISQCDFDVEVLFYEDKVCDDSGAGLLRVIGEYDEYTVAFNPDFTIDFTSRLNLGDGYYRFTYRLNNSDVIRLRVSNAPSVEDPEEACVWEQDLDITINSSEAFIATYPRAATCASSDNGELDFTVFNAPSFFNSAQFDYYLWPETADNLSYQVTSGEQLLFQNLTAGFYAVSIDNNAYCDRFLYVEIYTNIDQPYFEVVAVDPLDENGENASVMFDFELPYWTIESSFFTGELTGSQMTFEGLDEGEYPYSVSSILDLGCTWDYVLSIPFPYAGCIDDSACNYDEGATETDDSCTFPGCTDPLAENFDPNAGCDGFCEYAADFNNDGFLDGSDFISMLGDFGCVGPDCLADLNNDGVVNTVDLLSFLSVFSG